MKYKCREFNQLYIIESHFPINKVYYVSNYILIRSNYEFVLR